MAVACGVHSPFLGLPLDSLFSFSLLVSVHRAFGLRCPAYVCGPVLDLFLSSSGPFAALTGSCSPPPCLFRLRLRWCLFLSPLLLFYLRLPQLFCPSVICLSRSLLLFFQPAPFRLLSLGPPLAAPPPLHAPFLSSFGLVGFSHTWLTSILCDCFHSPCLCPSFPRFPDFALPILTTFLRCPGLCPIPTLPTPLECPVLLQLLSLCSALREFHSRLVL